ncbi:phage tail sheath subtilisin-like domain-containing protein [Sphingomonas sp. UV9]|uniref:phage tail sheath subtilisin-like domain-containing protein n=1 Tax=Sphingomonas sp. UV9 TaxID=1851410 RepID=UPI0019D2242D|nr:phage tail sheath subtilisin-like domain-containing protein [Sphingomonas sp. UV9]
MTFFHGLQFTESVTGVRPLLEKSTAIIGLVATAIAAVGAPTAALDAAFPVNRPVLITDIRAAIAAAGTGGTLAPALNAIADQGTPVVIVVRVAAGADAATTTANIIGGLVDGKYTGMQALLAAEAQVGVRPRIIGAPGLDSQAVVAALIPVAKSLRGFIYASCRGITTVGAAIAYREEFSARELMLIWPDATAWDGQAVAIALGLRAMIDEETGWHKSLSNVAIAGVTGLSKDVHFDIRDPSTDAGLLNQAPVTTIVRMNGYRFWGNRTCSDEPAFAFEPVKRAAQALQDLLADVEAPFIDQPITVALVRDLVEAGNALTRRLVGEGRLVGAKVSFDGTANPAEMLAAGKLVLDADYTAPAPLEGLTTNLRVTSAYYENFGEALNS